MINTPFNLTVSEVGIQDRIFSNFFVIFVAGQGSYDIVVSPSNLRTSPIALNSQSLSGLAYIFIPQVTSRSAYRSSSVLQFFFFNSRTLHSDKGNDNHISYGHRIYRI